MMDTLVVGQCNGLCCIVDLLPRAVKVLLEMFTFVLSLGKELFMGFSHPSPMYLSNMARAFDPGPINIISLQMTLHMKSSEALGRQCKECTSPDKHNQSLSQGTQRKIDHTSTGAVFRTNKEVVNIFLLTFSNLAPTLP